MNTVCRRTDFHVAIAHYVKVSESEAFSVDCDWSDAELASMPCASGTAENMVRRSEAQAGMRAVVPGASAGVRVGVYQLLKRHNAQVIAVTSALKIDEIHQIGVGAGWLRRSSRSSFPSKV